MKRRVLFRVCVFFAAVFCLDAVVIAEIALPAWVTDDGVVSVTYRFETGETNPVPSVSAGLIGAPVMLIDKVTEVSAGWVEEGTDFITRGNGGTWELGESGFMSLVLPVIGTSAPDACVDFCISTVVAEGMEVQPEFEVGGVLEPSCVSEVIEPDPFMWSWVQQVCTGQVSLAMTTNLSFSLICPDGSSMASTIDEIVVYAKADIWDLPTIVYIDGTLIEWISYSNCQYTISRSTNLTECAFEPIYVMEGTGSRVSFTDPDDPEKAFYKIQMQRN